MSSGKPVVLIADDHPMIRLALRLGVMSVAYEARVIEVESFDLLRKGLADEPHLDLVLLDLIMPDVDGFSALLYLRERRPELRVAVVSALDARSASRMVGALGACGFIHKTARPEEIQIALRLLLAGGETWPPPGGTSGESSGSTQEQASERLTRLTPQELRALLLIRDGLLNKQIADLMHISESTVKIHVSAILRKLEVGTRTAAAMLAQKLLAAPLLTAPADSAS